MAVESKFVHAGMALSLLSSTRMLEGCVLGNCMYVSGAEATYMFMLVSSRKTQGADSLSTVQWCECAVEKLYGDPANPLHFLIVIIKSSNSTCMCLTIRTGHDIAISCYMQWTFTTYFQQFIKCQRTYDGARGLPFPFIFFLLRRSSSQQ